jgi:membrane protein YqaA with SNARE-associated domain
MGISIRLFGVFLTWWGLVLLGALDASLFVFIPFGTDAVVIYMCARDAKLFWLYPLLTTAGSVAGAAVTYVIGARISATSLDRFVSPRRLEQFQTRLKTIGPFTLGVSAILPPPFPLTAFVLVSGALKVPLVRFLAVFATARLLRFGAEALLARRFGTSLLRMLESEPAQRIAVGLVVVSIAGTALTIVRVWRSSRPARHRSR